MSVRHPRRPASTCSSVRRATTRPGPGRLRRRRCKRRSAERETGRRTRPRPTPAMSCPRRAAPRRAARGGRGLPLAWWRRPKATRSVSARCPPSTRRRRGVTRDRLYLETMQQVYSRRHQGADLDTRAGGSSLLVPAAGPGAADPCGTARGGHAGGSAHAQRTAAPATAPAPATCRTRHAGPRRCARPRPRRHAEEEPPP
jgi:hypothetical protein